MAICNSYHNGPNNTGTCWGTKEQDPCDCKGQKVFCDFYDYVREEGLKEESPLLALDAKETLTRWQRTHSRNYTVFAAIDALDKQIPKCPTMIRHIVDDLAIDFCPRCEEGVNEEMKYCPACGQAIDWKENNNG